jgi:ABC-type branched-subunit amino acid transport system permease subunit
MISLLALFSAKTFAATAGIVAVVSQIFQNNDHTSVWLAFALAWIACALTAIASSSLVFRVAEVRKRITRRR